MIYLKSDDEIAAMRVAGSIVARALRAMSEAIVPNKTTPLELDAIGRRIIEEADAYPSFLNYRGFPASVCISVDEAIVHGIPDDKPLREGQIVGLDLGACYKRFHADGAWTYPVGRVDPETQRLLNVTRESLIQGIQQVKPGNRVGDISATIQRYVERNSYSVVRDLVGHGIGKSIHEEPSIPNYGRPGQGPRLKEGMTFCVEPMVNQGTHKVKTLKDNWTMVTADGKLSAHFEHTVVVTKSGCDILTVE